MPVPPLTEHALHLWFAFPGDIADPELLARYRDWLSDEERAQWQRFHFERHRHQYLVTRALVRSTLSRYVDVAPKDWRFSRNAHGKPDILPGLTERPLRFNLSHTDGLVLCGVVLRHDIGVDVECRERNNATASIAEHYFSAQEVAALRALPKERQKHRFFDYWTLKEAYIKARGIGLSLPLQQFTFELAEQRAATIRFDSRMQEHAAHWRFWRIEVSERHVAAVAVQSAEGKDFELTMRTVVPACRSMAFAGAVVGG